MTVRFAENFPTKLVQITLLSAIPALALARLAVAQPDVAFGAEPFDGSTASPLMTFLGDLHPLAVHFPLALGFTALMFETLFLVSKKEVWRSTAFHTLTFGASVSLLTIFTGLTASTVGPFFGEDAQLLETHRLFGLVAAGLLLLTTFLAAQVRLKKRDQLVWVYRAVLLLTVICVFSAGHFGARLSGLSPF